MGKVYYDRDGHIEAIQDKVIAIIGYGNQGRSQALNMRDSGVKHIIVGSIHDSSWNTANEDGFETYSIADAAKKADVVFLLLPDEVAPEIYERDIAPNLHPGAALNFASGYNITYGFIKPAADLDVIMVAPRMIGKGVRETYENGTGFPTFVVINQDATGHAQEIAVGLAKALGSTKAGAIEVTFNDETYLDLMSEQAIWPLIMNVLVTAHGHDGKDGGHGPVQAAASPQPHQPVRPDVPLQDGGQYLHAGIHRGAVQPHCRRQLRPGVGGSQGRRYEEVRRAAG